MRLKGGIYIKDFLLMIKLKSLGLEDLVSDLCKS